MLNPRKSHPFVDVHDSGLVLDANWAGYPSHDARTATLNDRIPKPIIYPVKELTARLRRGRCELCEQPATVQVHQIRELAQLDKIGADQPAWTALVTRMRRKTLVVCHPCHETIHDRQPTTLAA
jgi:hypothetical protein